MSPSTGIEKMQSELVERRHRPTFTVACCSLAMVAFLQLVMIGTALTVRLGKPERVELVERADLLSYVEPVQPRSLDQILSEVKESGKSFGSSPVIPNPINRSLQPSFSPVVASEFPMIANPRVERLVQEAKGLQMDGDIMRAALKLEEAGSIDPTEPAVMYHQASLYENTGNYVQAADHYQKVQQMGYKAGVYFKIAARKLTEGMDTAAARRNVISIGPMHVRKVESPQGVREAKLNISIQARPDAPINPDDVTVNVFFYDQINGAGGGEVKSSGDTSVIDERWQDDLQDWKDVGNEERLIILYKIPDSNYTDEYLLGQREYYGFVVELVYKGEVIDQQARPRRLHSIHGSSLAPHYQGGSLPWLPSDMESLLPSIDGQLPPSNVMPPLPSR